MRTYKKTKENRRPNPAPCLFLNLHVQTSAIGTRQSPQIMLTFLVARTLCPQQGQATFRVLEVLPVAGGVTPPFAPGPPTPRMEKPTFRFIIISSQPWVMMNSISASVGSVMLYPIRLS